MHDKQWQYSAVYLVAVGAECYAQYAEVELQKNKLFVLYSTNRSYFFIGRLDHESYNTDLLNSIYPAGSILNIIYMYIN